MPQLSSVTTLESLEDLGVKKGDEVEVVVKAVNVFDTEFQLPKAMKTVTSFAQRSLSAITVFSVDTALPEADNSGTSPKSNISNAAHTR